MLLRQLCDSKRSPHEGNGFAGTLTQDYGAIDSMTYEGGDRVHFSLFEVQCVAPLE